MNPISTANVIANHSAGGGIPAPVNVSAPSAIWQRAKERLNTVEELLHKRYFPSALIGRAAGYHLATGGKRFRPLMVLAVGESLNCDPQITQHLAVATELLHNASLVHDDLQDNDTFRRGRETVWKRFGPETAINLGDLFITDTYLELTRIEVPDVNVGQLVSLFADSSRKVIAGQSAEMEASRRIEIGPKDYLRIAKGKSGVLMALPVVSVLTALQADSETITNARQAMEWLGVSYQIQDDLADIYGHNKGRPAGVDLREGRCNLPVIFFYESASATDQKAFKAFVTASEPSGADQVGYWVDRIQKSEAVKRCRASVEMADQIASRHLENLTHSLLRETLKAGRDILLSTASRQNRGSNAILSN